MKSKKPKTAASQPSSPDLLFEEWWRTDGVYYDPDTQDVDWFDKRKELAAHAFLASLSILSDLRTEKEELLREVRKLRGENALAYEALTKMQEESNRKLEERRGAQCSPSNQ